MATNKRERREMIAKGEKNVKREEKKEIGDGGRGRE